MTTEKEKQEQRLRNLLIFKIYATDEERDEATPFIALLAFIVVLVYLLAQACGS